MGAMWDWERKRRRRDTKRERRMEEERWAMLVPHRFQEKHGLHVFL